MKRSIVFLFVLTLLGGCLSAQVLPEEKLPVAPQATTPPPPLNFISFDLVPAIDRNLSMSELMPEIESMKAVEFSNPVNVLDNDLGVANVPDKNELVNSIVDSREVIYIGPENDPSAVVFYTIFRFNSSKSAERVLEIYRTSWNTESVTVADKTVWLWRGYSLESSGLLRPFTNIIIYYHSTNKKAFLSESRQNLPALAEVKEPLYSLHGETAVGEYFLMMDIKARLSEVENRSMKIFEEILTKIKINETAQILQQPPLPELNKTEALNATGTNITQEIETLEINLKLLLDRYLKGNITKEQYDAKQQEYLKRIEELRGNSSAK